MEEQFNRNPKLVQAKDILISCLKEDVEGKFQIKMCLLWNQHLTNCNPQK